MDCPQCGGTLATYALSGREASVCEDCGYVGIAAEHRGEPHRIESWNDALRRFYDTDEDPSVELRPPLSRPSADGPAEESWDDALRRFYDRRTGGSDESAADRTEAERESVATEANGADDTETDAERGDDGTDGADPARSQPSQSSAGDS